MSTSKPTGNETESWKDKKVILSPTSNLSWLVPLPAGYLFWVITADFGTEVQLNYYPTKIPKSVLTEYKP